jgi:hypothetical protein
MEPTIQAGEPFNTTSSAVVRYGAGAILSIFVASASGSPSIKLWDNTAASGTVLVNTFTPVAATPYRIEMQFKTGLYITIGGTVDCTLVLAPTGAV